VQGEVLQERGLQQDDLPLRHHHLLHLPRHDRGGQEEEGAGRVLSLLQTVFEQGNSMADVWACAARIPAGRHQEL
jgi:hypothetical protein